MSKWEAHEFDDHFMVKQPGGGSFPVAKKGLSEEVLSRIKGYAPVKMAEGGIVPSPEDISTPPIINPESIALNAKIPTRPASPEEQMAGSASMVPVKPYSNTVIVPAGGTQQDNSETVQTPGVMTPAVATADGTMMPETKPQKMDPAGGMFGALGKLESGAQGLESAAAQYGKDVDNVYKDQNAAMADAKNAHDERERALLQKSDQLADDVATGKVDPNRFWNNMSTGNKVTAAIALALGGIGSGLTGRPNAALEVINKSIDNDISAQKEALSSKQTLYSQNLQTLRDERAAYAQTKADLITMAQAKLGAAAAKVGTAQAIQTARTQAAELQIKKIGLLKEVAQTQLLNSAMNNGQDLPPNAVNALPKEYRERYVPGEGFALSGEGAKELRKLKADHDTSMQGIDRLLEIRKTHGRQALPGELAAEAKTIAGTLQGRLRTFLVGPGAVSDSERKILERIVNSDPTAIATLDSTVLGSLMTLKKAVGNGYQNALVSEGVKSGSKTFKPQ